MKRALPDKMRFTADRTRLEGYLYILDSLIGYYEEDPDLNEKLILVMLQRIRTKLKTLELKNQYQFAFTFSIEYAQALHIALKTYGGPASKSWATHYYDTLIFQIDPVVS